MADHLSSDSTAQKTRPDTEDLDFGGELNELIESRSESFGSKNSVAEDMKKLLGDAAACGHAERAGHPGEHRTAEQLGKRWNQAVNSRNFSSINEDLGRAVQSAYSSGGEKTMVELQQQINSYIDTPGQGPLFLYCQGAVEIHHVRHTPVPEQLGLSKSDNKAAGLFHHPAAGWVKDLAPPYTVKLPDRQEKTTSAPPSDM